LLLLLDLRPASAVRRWSPETVRGNFSWTYAVLVRAGCVNGVPHPQTRGDSIAKQRDRERRKCLNESALHLSMPVGLHAVPAAAVLAALFCDAVACQIKTICALQRRAVMHLIAPFVFHILTGS